MRSSEYINELCAALALAQAEFRSVAKTGRNQQQSYDYADTEDYLRVARPILAKHGLSVVSSCSEVVAAGVMPTRQRDWPIWRARVVVRILHSSGQWLEGDAWGDGADGGDKGVYKAQTGGRKYGLALLLGLATGDDAEGDERTDTEVRATTPPAQTTQERATDSQREQLRHMGKNPNLSAAVSEWCAGAAMDPTLTSARAVAALEKCAALIAQVQKGGDDGSGE
jgi:hypothetical protein